MSQSPTNVPGADVVAVHDRLFRMKRYLIVFMLVGAGAWFSYDGFYNWPRQAEQARELELKGITPSEKPHSQRDIASNQYLGVLLPIAGLLALIYFLYTSRGEYRLSGGKLHIPGHGPIDLESISLIDKSKWDRKGIARIEYEVGGKTRAFRLDNFIYQEEPTRLIVSRLEEALFPDDAEKSGEAAPGPDRPTDTPSA